MTWYLPFKISIAKTDVFAIECLDQNYSGVTGGSGEGGKVPPRDFCPRNFCWPTGKKRGKEERENGAERKENRKKGKRKGRKLKMDGKKLQNEERTFCFSLFKTTDICFGSTKIGIFYREKSFHAGKKIMKNYFCSLWKIFLLRPCLTQKCETYQEISKRRWKRKKKYSFGGNINDAALKMIKKNGS